MASSSSEYSESSNDESVFSTLYGSPSDVSDIEGSGNHDQGVIQPYMYEPDASGSESNDSDDAGSEDEERFNNTDWYGCATVLYAVTVMLQVQLRKMRAHAYDY